MSEEVAAVHEAGEGSDQQLPGASNLPVADQAEVDRLASELAAGEKIDPLPGAGGDQPGADQSGSGDRAMTFGEEAAMAIDMMADMAEAYDPACKQFWPEKTKKQCAVALGVVLKKYNFSLFRSPELVLLVTLGPPLFQTSKAIAQVMNAKAAEVAAAPPGGPVGGDANS